MQSVKLRPAERNDSAVILKWQNQDGARQYCRNPRKIDSESHETWFEAKLKEADSFLYIILLDRDPVGFLRIERLISSLISSETIHYEVSLIISSESQGKGVGFSALTLAVDRYKEIIHQLPRSESLRSNLVAEVLNQNTVSKRLFLSAGFESFQLTDASEWFVFPNKRL